jgi:hypothetical protein
MNTKNISGIYCYADEQFSGVERSLSGRGKGGEQIACQFPHTPSEVTADLSIRESGFSSD